MYKYTTLKQALRRTVQHALCQFHYSHGDSFGATKLADTASYWQVINLRGFGIRQGKVFHP